MLSTCCALEMYGGHGQSGYSCPIVGGVMLCSQHSMCVLLMEM